jgi:hypothetical protein
MNKAIRALVKKWAPMTQGCTTNKEVYDHTHIFERCESNHKRQHRFHLIPISANILSSLDKLPNLNGIPDFKYDTANNAKNVKEIKLIDFDKHLNILESYRTTKQYMYSNNVDHDWYEDTSTNIANRLHQQVGSCHIHELLHLKSDGWIYIKYTPFSFSDIIESYND